MYLLLPMFPGAVAAASAVLMQRSAASQSLSASGDLLRSLLAVADAHLVFARELFVTSSVLPQVCQWAVAAAALREKEPANAAFSFLSHFLAASGKLFSAAAEAAAAGGAASPEQQAAAAAAATLQQCIAAQGQQLMQTLVVAACDTAPRQLLRALASVLYQLLQEQLTGESGRQWLLAALQSQELPGALQAERLLYRVCYVGGCCGFCCQAWRAGSCTAGAINCRPFVLTSRSSNAPA